MSRFSLCKQSMPVAKLKAQTPSDVSVPIRSLYTQVNVPCASQEGILREKSHRSVHS
jgi:hypothetical protein